jgi:ornithine cyclodeaminase/alanine dehydrogenase-like protein (mu-crystallin family)
VGEILVLSARDVDRCLDRDALVNAMEVACREVSAGTAEMPVRLTLRLPGPRGVMSAMPAYLSDAGGLATKLVTSFAGNPSRGLPLIMGVVVLNDAVTGAPLAVMDGAMITGLRTAATSALSCRLLAIPEARSLAVIGSGLQARTHIDALLRVRPISDIRVTSRTREGAQALVDELQQGMPRVKLTATDVERAVSGADIVVCASTAADPVLRMGWLNHGAHICAIGSHSPGKRELDSETVTACAVIAADTRAGCLAEADDVRVPIEEGTLDPARVVELGQIILGQARGRQSHDETTLYKSVGMAAMDVASAQLAYRTATRIGAGSRVEL